MAASELLTSISTLSRKVDDLLEKQKKLLSRIKELENEKENLISQHMKDQEELKKTKKEVEFLSLSHRLADSPQALIEARNIVSSLIRTVDSCIRLIRED